MGWFGKIVWLGSFYQINLFTKKLAQSTLADEILGTLVQERWKPQIFNTEHNHFFYKIIQTFFEHTSGTAVMAGNGTF